MTAKFLWVMGTAIAALMVHDDARATTPAGPTLVTAIPPASGVMAAADGPGVEAVAGAEQDAIKDAPKDIIVSAPIAHSEADVLSGTSIVSGQELTRSLQPTIGETLAHQPGVSATSFGPNASRPILRGFQGERIRVLTDGIGSIDVSNTSVDHAVIIDPLLADRIEVLRGPAALLYGSSAVGGIVNVIDKRIPRTVPADGYRLDAIGTYGSAASQRSLGAATDVAITDRIVLHADGSYLKTGDQRIGGFALTPQRRAEAQATSRIPQIPHPGEAPIDFASNAAIRGTLPNTASETWTAGFGAALINDTSNFGVSYSHYDSLYGVPIRYATLPGQGEESPRIDIVQNRVDVRAAVDTGGDLIKEIRFRAGAANYRQFELEPDGAIATTFTNRGLEGRLEIVQAKRGALIGASGVQFSQRNFDVIGDEAFLPRSATTQLGLFTQQQIDLGAFKAEAGVRYELTDHAARPLAGDNRFFGGGRHFDAFSGAIGASYGFNDTVRLGVNLSRTERAPSAEELFANGSHAGTQAYELGNPDFGLERSWGLEGTLHIHSDRFSIDASAYYNWFTDYIADNQVNQSICEVAAAPSGRDVDLPCFQLSQGDARYYGFEIDGSVKVAQIGAYAVNIDALGDYVHATLVGQGPVPRIPAGRILGGVEAQSDLLSARVEAEHVFTQDRLAAFETVTQDYTVVNVSFAVSPFANKKTTLTFSANNLFDVEARRHASFLKDFAPLAGRDIRLTLRFDL